MSNVKKSAPINFITGGDLIWHRGQLFVANWLRIALIFLISWTVTWQIFVMAFVTEGARTLFAKVIFAKLMKFLFMPGFRISYVTENGETVRASAARFLLDIYSNPTLSSEFTKIVVLGSFAALLAVAISVFAVWLNLKFGVKAQKDEFLRGQKIVEPEDLEELVERPSPIKIGNVPIPLSHLARNFITVGSMGTGKSQVIFPMFDQARAWGKKCIVYDKTGEFVQKFYRPGNDFILNPVDARCEDWSLFCDLRKVTDPAMVSRFFVPENKKSSDPVWDNAARMLLEDVITIVSKRGGTMEEVREIITQHTLADLAELLAAHNSPSCGVINPQNERGSESVRLTLTAQPAIRFFQFFNSKAAQFSIRDFVSRNDDACLFLVSNSTQHEAIKPFISAWIELALAEAMSMKSTMDVRLMFFLDELASLSKLSALDIALTEARKYGIVTLVGIQNLAQLEEIYGREMTRVMVANLQNKFVLRTEEEASAKQLADTLGKEEVEEVNESKSFGVEASRDGVNLGTKRTERNLVLATELMTLPDLTGWLKLAGDFPIAKVSVPYASRVDVAEGYVERDGLDLTSKTSTSEPAEAVLVDAQPETTSEPVEYVSPVDEVVEAEEAAPDVEDVAPIVEAEPAVAEETNEEEPKYRW